MFKNRAFADLYDNAASCEFETNGESFVEDEGSESQAKCEEKEDVEGLNEHVLTAENSDQEMEEASARSDVVDHAQQDVVFAATADSKAVEDLLLGTKHDSEKVSQNVSAAASIQEHKKDVERSSSAVAATKTLAHTQLKKEAALQETSVLTPQQIATLSEKLHDFRVQIEQEVENEKVKILSFFLAMFSLFEY